MFHLQDNVYFERQPDGCIRIVVRQGDQADAPIIKDTTCKPEGFASVMASMCAFGEDLKTWTEACQFLERPYQGDDTAYTRWRDQHPGQSNPLCDCLERDGAHSDDCEFWRFVLALRRDWPGRNDHRPV